MKFNLKRLFAILVLLLFTALLFLPLVGCGAKKSESQKIEEISKIDYAGIFRNSGNSEEFLKSLWNLESNSITKVDDQNEKTTTKKTFKPQNPNAPATYVDGDGKKHELNNAIYTEETIVEKNNKKSENSQKSQKSLNQDLQKKVAFNKDQELKRKAEATKIAEAEKLNRDSWHLPFWIWLILIIIVFLILWYLNKRFHVTTFIAGLFQFRKK